MVCRRSSPRPAAQTWRRSRAARRTGARNPAVELTSWNRRRGWPSQAALALVWPLWAARWPAPGTP